MELSDFDKKNAFDVEAYMNHTLKMGVNEKFDYIEVEVAEEDLSEDEASSEDTNDDR
jgi:type IV secretion system protein VirD4